MKEPARGEPEGGDWDGERPLEPVSPPNHWLIRQSGFGIGQLQGRIAEEMVDEALEMAGFEWDAVHVFPRDYSLPGIRGYEPGQSDVSRAIAKIFGVRLSHADVSGEPCNRGAHVLDVILVEPNHWLIGYHRAEEVHQTWPGGSFPVSLPSEMISRAYLKMAEALAWSRLPIEPGDRFVEIGSSPGGACQRLLDLGLEVTGIDPAEMHPLLVDHPRFEHWRGKSSSIKRKRYAKFRWLAADANVAPNYTLEAVEDIVTYPTSRFQGLILTLKLSNYDLVDQMGHYLERIRGWGFARVEVRQLSFNRRECCVVAAR